MKFSNIFLMLLVLILFSFQSVTISEDATASKNEITGNIDVSQFGHLKAKYNAKLKFPVQYLLEKNGLSQANDEEFTDYVKSYGFATKGKKVKVAVEFSNDVEELVTENVIKRYEIDDFVAGKKWFKGYLPVNKIERILDEFPEITSINQVKLAKHTALTTEGLSLVNGTEWQSAGNDGSGVKVAIIDSGFQYISNMVANGDFTSTYTAVDFTGTGFPGTYYHGTECAAIVYDFVPNADFYLIMISDNYDFQLAKDYCIANGIDVVSMSLGWDGFWFGDGNGDVCDTAKAMANNGILVVNSAGNEAENLYWYGSWSDANSNDLMEFDGSDETNSMSLARNTIISLRLTWDNSYSSDQDYDLYVYDASGRIVAASENWQNGSTQPAEYINYLVKRTSTYHVVIKNYSANGTSNFRLYCSEPFALEYASAAYSIVDPGTAPEVFSVGAIRDDFWNSSPVPIEYFSSQGPNTAGDIKPDICGPDGTISTYYTTGFYGTSAACPHVAGAAALYWSSATSTLDANQVRSYLETTAIDCGAAGKDNVFGYGKLYLGTPGPVPGKVTLVSPLDNAIDQPTTIDFEWQAPSTSTPTAYELQVATDSGFASIVYNNNMLVATTQQVSGLAMGTTYFWRVRSYDNGWETWSNVWSFSTIAAPGQVVLSSPSNAATNQALSLTLKWNAASGTQPITYFLQVATDSGFSNLVEDLSGLASTEQLISGLAYNTTYYWHVQAENAYGLGAWSATWSFTTIPPATLPGQVTLVSPANGATKQKSTIVFEWNTPTGTAPFTYQLQIATDSGFTSLVYDNATLSSTSNRVSGLPKATTMYWRVRAGNTAGWGPWSTTRTFATK